MKKKPLWLKILLTLVLLGLAACVWEFASSQNPYILPVKRALKYNVFGMSTVDREAERAGLEADSRISLDDAVLRGLKEAAAKETRLLLADTEAMELVNGHLIPALDEVGSRFENGTLFLPQLLQSASAAQAAFEEIKKHLSSSAETIQKGPILLATVQGDVHDIGKNIVKVILENYGYAVVDLGKDVPAARVVEETLSRKIPLVGLSALMTTTVPAMEETIRALKASAPDTKIMVGGAVLTPEYAKMIGADYYAKDAKQAVDLAKKVFG